MSLTMIGIISICVLFVLMFIGMPIGFAMALVGLVGIVLIRGSEAALINMAILTFRNSASYMLVAVPLFVWMGFLAVETGLIRGVFYAMNKLVGHLRGGLAISTIIGCAFFGAICGDVIAATITMKTMALPEMRRYKYNDKLSLGCLAAAANLSSIIPPSILMIIYCVLTEGSIGKLFIAGILPGILLTILFIITVLIICRINPEMAAVGPKASWIERIKSFGGIWKVGVIAVLVLGGIYGGVFSPTEAGGIGVFGIVIIGLFNRQLTRQIFLKSIENALGATGMVFILIIGSNIFSTLMVTTEIPYLLADFITNLSLHRNLVLIVILLFYFIIGCIMDITSVMIITAPIFYTIFKSLGFDPTFIGLLTMISIVIGNITPPFGIVVFTLSGITTDVPILDIFRGALPFVAAMLLGLILLVAFPQITLFLPNLMR